MAILDLQGMTAPASNDVRYGKSGSSKGCGNVIGGPSGLSLLFC
jgi:hypothetical protein